MTATARGNTQAHIENQREHRSRDRRGEPGTKYRKQHEGAGEGGNLADPAGNSGVYEGDAEGRARRGQHGQDGRRASPFGQPETQHAESERGTLGKQQVPVAKDTADDQHRCRDDEDAQPSPADLEQSLHEAVDRQPIAAGGYAIRNLARTPA